MSRQRATLAIAAFLWAALAPASGAQGTASTLRAALETCASLRQDVERLACYDRTVAQIAHASDARDPPRAVPEAMFGLSSQTAAPKPTQDARTTLDSIEAKVISLVRDADASLVIALDNGQKWRQQDSRELMLAVGDQVTIARAALGSFRILTPKRRFGRVRRLE